MLRRFFSSRGMRKFRRDRLALASSFVIGFYALIAMGVGLFGLVSLDDTNERVLPNRYPGFLEGLSLDEELAFARWWSSEHLLPSFYDPRNPIESEEELRQIARDQLNLGEREIVDAPLDEVLALAEELRIAAEGLDEAWALREEYADEIVAIDIISARAEGAPDPGLLDQRAELEAALVEANAASRVALAEVEAAIDAIQPLPTGWDGLVYRLKTVLGSDSKGASISAQAVYSIKVAFQVGLVTALVSVLFGSLLGAAAGFFGAWVDQFVMWLVSTLSSIPYLVLLTVIAYAFTGSTFDNPEKPALSLIPIYVAFCSVFWISTCRVVRGEVLKIKELEYVQAATAVGFSRPYILLRHVIPNTTHLMFINFSLLFIGAIKSEVILSFLGLGVEGQPSWGIMINLGADGVLTFQFWEVGVATVFMFVLVLAFNLVSDALQDAFDPKHVG